MAELLDKLNAGGAVDLEDGLKRMMGNENLYVRCLKMFIPQAKASRLPELIESGNTEDAIKDVHNLKGVTGNLSLKTLYVKYNEILRRLRENELGGIKQLVDEATAEQKRVCKIIESCA